MEKLEKERLEIEGIIEEKLERDKLERDIYKITRREEKDRTFKIDSFIETNNEFWNVAQILIENEEQKNDKSKIQELTLEIKSLKEKMEQFQPRYASNGTIYFSNNQRSQNIYPQMQGRYEFQSRARFNYNQNFRYSNPNNWFKKNENQISKISNKQIEGNLRWSELTNNAIRGE